MEGRITAVEKSIDKRKLLVAAGRGDSEELKCLLAKKVDVNFPDEDGYTPLHYAVESGEFDVVQQLLEDKEVDVFVESNDNRSPLDIAREIKNQDIIDIVVEKIIDKTFEVLEESSNIDKPDRPSSDTKSDEVTEKMNQTEDKIESCLEFLRKINAVERSDDQKDISYGQANILIYFIETFALEGDPDTKYQLKKYFSQYYTELDRKLFSDARKRLLKISSSKRLRLEDIGTFINGDIKSFFIKLEEYVQYVQHVKVLKVFLESTASELRSQGTEEIDVRPFLRGKFGEFTEEYQMQGKIKKDEVFNFIAQFYPEFNKTRDRVWEEPANEEVDSFFIELQEYAQYVQHVQQLEDRRSTEVETSLMDKLNKSGHKPQKDITSAKLFDFILNFYPAFYESCNGHTLLSDLCTKVQKYAKCGHHVDRLEFLLKGFEGHNGDVTSFLQSQIKKSLIEPGRPDGVMKILQEYVQRTQQERFFLKTLKDKECNIGEDIDVGSYVKKEFEKLMVTSYTEENITQELLFNFVVNFYPAFERETTKDTQAGLRELRSLRNNLIHDFHKYGAIEFGKEISRLRHRLLKYYFAQQVSQALWAIEQDEDPVKINKTFENKLKTFKDRYPSIMQREYVISTDEVEDFFGYRLSQVYFPERVDHSETLVDQYLKFMVIVDCAEDSPIDNEQDQNPQSRKELNAFSRREIFEEFCRLRRTREHSHGNGNYCDAETLRFEKRLLDEYGVQNHHFHKICSLYMGNESSQFDHSTESKKIAAIIESLKKIKEDYRLSNRVVIFLYDQCLNDKSSFGSDEHRRLLGKETFNHPKIIKKFKHLPSDEIMNISIGEETLSISRGKVISNMLNTFYNTYYAGTIQFNIEDIFNDETFLDYLVVKETEITEEKVEDLVVLYLQLTLMVDRDKQKMYEGSPRKKISCEERKKIFEGFYSLKKLKEHQNDKDRNYYEKAKREFRELVFSYGIKQQDFDNLYKCCVEEDYDLTDEEDGDTQVKVLMNYLKSELKQYKKLSNKMIASLFKEAMKGKVCSEQVRGVLQTEDGVENIVKILNNLPNPDKNAVSIQLGSEKWSVDIKNVTCDMLEAFDDKDVVKLKTYNYMIIKKLLKVDYTAPYIVRLITRVESDAIIEKDDLVRLVEILLLKEDSLYIKPLNELLKLGSRKLNLYEEVCNKIVEPSFNIYSMRLIFEEYQHVKGILTVLIDRIRFKDQSKDKMIELSKKVFEILEDHTFAFIFPNYEGALEIFDHGLKLIKVIKSTLIEPNGGGLIGVNESNDSIIAAEYNIKLKMAKVKNYQGRQLDGNQSPDNDKAKKKYNEALKILREIPDNVHPQSLLASSREAWTHSLLKQHDKAYRKWKLLYKKIVELVCGSYRSNTELYTKEMYNEIERSEKYKILLALSKECGKYLNILSIRNCMARDLLSRGFLHNKVEHCKKALEIYKEIYSYQKDNLGPKHKSIISNASYITRAHASIAQLLFRKKDYQDALKHREYALLQNVRLTKIQKDMCGNYHPEIDRRMKFIVNNLYYIAELNEKLADAESMENRKITFHKKARRLYDKIHGHRKRYLGEWHEFTLKTKRQAESVGKQYTINVGITQLVDKRYRT